ncbi:hypothetical protein ACN38_g12548 [Penicillium nordicum]|uniref:Uncharacterized protein n=1 Tax=Penicillium nordicum TaxID=229535 RepID=A0A0M8NPF6_9EURO|nr:hypothetical protein ACN38_g12548 [Penicillium nordicum]
MLTCFNLLEDLRPYKMSDRRFYTRYPTPRQKKRKDFDLHSVPPSFLSSSNQKRDVIIQPQVLSNCCLVSRHTVYTVQTIRQMISHLPAWRLSFPH